MLLLYLNQHYIHLNLQSSQNKEREGKKKKFLLRTKQQKISGTQVRLPKFVSTYSNAWAVVFLARDAGSGLGASSWASFLLFQIIKLFVKNIVISSSFNPFIIWSTTTTKDRFEHQHRLFLRPVNCKVPHRSTTRHGLLTPPHSHNIHIQHHTKFSFRSD